MAGPGELESTFSTAEALEAAGLRRALFDAWVLRGYIPKIGRPGTGNRRRDFTVLDVVRLRILADMNRLGVNIGVASRVAAHVRQDDLDRQNISLIVSPPKPGRGRAKAEEPVVAFGSRAGGTTVTIADFAGMVREVREELNEAIARREPYSDEEGASPGSGRAG